jgi:SAM-dependent methyltransferase
MSAGNAEYVLLTGDAGADRLALLQRTYGPTSQALLRQLGLSEGMRVLDLGCGTGTMTCWIASQLGGSGATVGADISASQLDVARRQAQRLGLSNVSFHESSVYETPFERASFDLVCCRFLLCHVGDPERGVREMHALLKPGGILLCEDVDVASLFCDPPSSGYDKMRDLMIALGASRGVDYCLGPRLHRIFRKVGFADPQVQFDQPVFARGERKRFWELTFLEAAPGMIAAGLTDEGEVQALAKVMRDVAEDETAMVAQARKVQVWGRKD